MSTRQDTRVLFLASKELKHIIAQSKKTCAPSSRASTSGVMHGILPRILKYDGDNLCQSTSGQFCEGPVPPGMIPKAKRLIESPNNYRCIYRGRGRSKVLQSVWLQSKFEMLSLHRVLVRGRTPRTAFQISPVWSIEDMARVRELLQCTCAASVRSGWVCSHVLTTLSLMKVLDITLPSVAFQHSEFLADHQIDDLRCLPMNPKTDTLVRRSSLHFFVGKPMHWSVLDDFEVEVEGNEKVIVACGGIVEGIYLAGDGYYRWTVRFGHHGLRTSK